MDALSVPPRRRRRHSPEFKAKVIAACQQPRVSVASVALEHGLNANMVRLLRIFITMNTEFCEA